VPDDGGLGLVRARRIVRSVGQPTQTAASMRVVVGCSRSALPAGVLAILPQRRAHVDGRPHLGSICQCGSDIGHVGAQSTSHGALEGSVVGACRSSAMDARYVDGSRLSCDQPVLAPGAVACAVAVVGRSGLELPVWSQTASATGRSRR